MDNKVLPLIQPTPESVFKNEWRLQILSLEKTIAFMDQQLAGALKRIRAKSEDDKAWLDFCETERPLIMQEAREAIRLLRLLSDPQAHCDPS